MSTTLQPLTYSYLHHEAFHPRPRYWLSTCTWEILNPFWPFTQTFFSGLVGFTLADGIGHSGRHGRRGGRAGFRRRGRQEGAPALDNYGAASALDSYGASDELSARDAELAALSANIPGVPGEDYPIYAEVPESGFTCDGQVDGGNFSMSDWVPFRTANASQPLLKIAGYYADPEAECQVFHICTSDANGGLSKYSFLCPNGTIFNQNYFICDWWFNFDCAEAADLYSLNDDIAAERDAAAGALDSYGAATESRASYGAPEETVEEYAAPVEYEYEYEDAKAAESYEAPTEVDLNALPTYEEAQPSYEGEAAPAGEVVEVRAGRRFRGRNGRRGGRRGGQRRPGRRQGRGRFRGWTIPSSFLSSTFWSLSYHPTLYAFIAIWIF